MTASLRGIKMHSVSISSTAVAPTYFFRDLFAGTNGTLLEDHTPDIAPTGFSYSEYNNTEMIISGSGSATESDPGSDNDVFAQITTNNNGAYDISGGYNFTAKFTFTTVTSDANTLAFEMQSLDGSTLLDITIVSDGSNPDTVTLTGTTANGIGLPTNVVSTSPTITDIVANTEYTLLVQVRSTGATMFLNSVNIGSITQTGLLLDIAGVVYSQSSTPGAGEVLINEVNIVALPVVAIVPLLYTIDFTGSNTTPSVDSGHCVTAFANPPGASGLPLGTSPTPPIDYKSAFYPTVPVYLGPSSTISVRAFIVNTAAAAERFNIDFYDLSGVLFLAVAVNNNGVGTQTAIAAISNIPTAPHGVQSSQIPFDTTPGNWTNISSFPGGPGLTVKLEFQSGSTISATGSTLAYPNTQIGHFEVNCSATLSDTAIVVTNISIS